MCTKGLGHTTITNSFPTPLFPPLSMALNFISNQFQFHTNVNNTIIVMFKILGGGHGMSGMSNLQHKFNLKKTPNRKADSKAICHVKKTQKCH